MTHHDQQHCPDPPACQLRLLTLTYPAFRFRRERAPRGGLRWAAERINGLDPGLHTLITADLHELRQALIQDRTRHAR